MARKDSLTRSNNIIALTSLYTAYKMRDLSNSHEELIRLTHLKLKQDAEHFERQEERYQFQLAIRTHLYNIYRETKQLDSKCASRVERIFLIKSFLAEIELIDHRDITDLADKRFYGEVEELLNNQLNIERSQATDIELQDVRFCESASSRRVHEYLQEKCKVLEALIKKGEKLECIGQETRSSRAPSLAKTASLLAQLKEIGVDR